MEPYKAFFFLMNKLMIHIQRHSHVHRFGVKTHQLLQSKLLMKHRRLKNLSAHLQPDWGGGTTAA